ncbi:hypothetical protein CBR_g3792 [Chara braunii]|uniref:Plastid lipid-associated protein/fibrillin conserved domain-containing protein n=1 Tax=Chara braunii TaxID=69332 RepID=A0A388KG99_CHABU|nr:hypothetical protein CBR_g3792 [Chara braunii]|eukprot:GBG69094.1 hypothetical protein CBR_g3792 [Chara braunii]
MGETAALVMRSGAAAAAASPLTLQAARGTAGNVNRSGSRSTRNWRSSGSTGRDYGRPCRGRKLRLDSVPSSAVIARQASCSSSASSHISRQDQSLNARQASSSSSSSRVSRHNQSCRSWPSHLGRVPLASSFWRAAESSSSVLSLGSTAAPVVSEGGWDESAGVVSQQTIEDKEKDKEKDKVAIIDDILALVEGTDRGANLSEDRKKEVEMLTQQLENLGGCEKPLENPLIFGNWRIAYASVATSTGGRFRGTKLRRSLFATSDLQQSITPPNILRNKFAFKILGLIDGDISLRGVLSPVEDSRTVRVDFDRPNWRIGPLRLTIGGESFVVLSTTFVDERVRVGRGKRGTLIIFTRA